MYSRKTWRKHTTWETGADGRISLKFISKKHGVKMWTWFKQLKTGSSGGILWTWQWGFELMKYRECLV